MNLFKGNSSTAAALDIDQLLQDSYLLVIELRHGSSPHDSRALWELCSFQIEEVRQRLKDAELSLRSIELISHAQCALLDETVLSFAEEARAQWANEPLQAKFFGRHQAGEFLYEEMREVLREPSPDPYVLTVYHRVLMLGFLGRYREIDDPERQQLSTALSARVPPLKFDQALPTFVGGRQGALHLDWLRSPLLHGIAAGLLLAGVWWGLDYLLADSIAALATGQV